MLKVLVAETAVVRTVLDLRDREFLRRLGNSGEIIKILILLGTSPYLDLPGPVLGTGLDDVNCIILYNLLGLDRLHTFRAEGIGLSDLLRHQRP